MLYSFQEESAMGEAHRRPLPAWLREELERRGRQNRKKDEKSQASDVTAVDCKFLSSYLVFF